MRKIARIKRTRRQTTVVEGFTATYNSDESPRCHLYGGGALKRSVGNSRPYGLGGRETAKVRCVRSSSVRAWWFRGGKRTTSATREDSLPGRYTRREGGPPRTLRRRRRSRRGRIARTS